MMQKPFRGIYTRMSEQALDTCICIDVRTAARRLTDMYDRALSPSGISVSQFSQLYNIQRLGNPTQKALSDATGLDRSTLGRNLRVLEKQGLVSIQPGEDARTKNITITKAGKAAFGKAAPLWVEVQQDLTNTIGRDGRHQLTQLLENLTGAAS